MLSFNVLIFVVNMVIPFSFSHPSFFVFSLCFSLSLVLFLGLSVHRWVSVQSVRQLSRLG
jgi:hypothetical protein